MKKCRNEENDYHTKWNIDYYKFLQISKQNLSTMEEKFWGTKYFWKMKVVHHLECTYQNQKSKTKKIVGRGIFVVNNDNNTKKCQNCRIWKTDMNQIIYLNPDLPGSPLIYIGNETLAATTTPLI